MEFKQRADRDTHQRMQERADVRRRMDTEDREVPGGPHLLHVRDTLRVGLRHNILRPGGEDKHEAGRRGVRTGSAAELLRDFEGPQIPPEHLRQQV